MDKIITFGNDDDRVPPIVKFPEYECKVHGNIGNATLVFCFELAGLVANHEGVYCMQCLVDALDSAVGQVSLVEDGG